MAVTEEVNNSATIVLSPEWEKKLYNPFLPPRHKLGRPYTFKEMEIKDLTRLLISVGAYFNVSAEATTFLLIDDNSIDGIEVSGKNIVFLIDWKSLKEKGIEYFNVNTQSYYSVQLSNYGIKGIYNNTFSVKQFCEFSDYEFLYSLNWDGTTKVTFDFKGDYIENNNEGGYYG